MAVFDFPDISLPILDAIRHNVERNPEYPLFSFEAGDGNVEKISWSRAGNAFNIAACHIAQDAGADANIEQAASVGPRSIGILASLDSITFYGIIVGALMAGYVPFLISIRNTPEAIANLLSLTKCGIVMSTGDGMTEGLVAKSIALFEDSGASKIHRITAPTYEQLYGHLSTPTSAPATATRTTAEVMDSPCVLSHSSGTTSLPKPITLTHRMVNQVGFRNRLEPESQFKQRTVSAHALPMFHLMGFSLIPWSTFLGHTLSLSMPTAPPIFPTPDVVLRAALATKAEIVYCAPTFIEAWASDTANMDALKAFEIVMYGGGPVREDVAALLVDNGVNLLPIMGLSETNVISSFNPTHIKTEGPSWYETDPLIDLVFIPEDEEKLKGVYRIVMKGNSIRQPASYDTVLDGVPAFDTKDLVMMHPTNPKLWKVVGRADDQITHSTGEKTNPVPIEAILEMSPYIKTALMFGRARLQPGVLIAPSYDQKFGIEDHLNHKRVDEYLNLIWDSISRANQSSPSHSRIFREMIIVADPTISFEYTAKGSLRRQATLQKYAKQIDQVYQVTDDSNTAEIPRPSSLKRNAVLPFIRSIVHKILEHEVADDADFFRVGVDSLCALSIRISITRGLLSSGLVSSEILDTAPRDLVYIYPSITTLADFVCSATFLNGKVTRPADVSSEAQSHDEDLRWQTVLQCNETLVELSPVPEHAGKPPLIVLHSGNGRVTSYRPFLRYRRGAWGVQMTPETPKTSVDAIAAFYLAKIKEKWPQGPYRFAAYSGSSIILMALVAHAERAGDKVIQFAMLDHFPALFFGGVDPRKIPTNDDAWMTQHVKGQLYQMATLLLPVTNVRARLFSDTLRIRRTQELIDALSGTHTTPESLRLLERASTIQRLSIKFLLEDRFTVVVEGNRVWSFDLFRNWVGGLKASLTLYVATEGSNVTIPEEMFEDQKHDLGASVFLGTDVRYAVVSIEGDHMSFLVGDELRRHLEDD